MEQNFIEDKLIILTKYTLDKFLQEKNPSDLIALYTFYYYTAKWQETNQPKCTDSYCIKGLHWGESRFRKTKKQLLKLGLIEQIIYKKADKITGWYIKLNYIFSEKLESEIKINVIKNYQNQVLENNSLNALSDINLNALSDNRIVMSEKSDITKNSNLENLIEKKYNDLPKSKIKKQIIYSNDFKEIISLWNSINRIASKHKNLNTKTIKESYKQYRYLLNGTFIKNNCILKETLIKYNIPIEDRKYTHTEIIQMLKNVMLGFEDGYYPFTLKEKKDKMPRTLLAAFFSDYFSCKSLMLKCYYNKPEYKPDLIKLKKNPYPVETAMIKEQCFGGQTLTIKQENQLIDTVDNLHGFAESLKSQSIYCKITKRKYTRTELDRGHFQARVVNFKGFIEYYIIYLNEIKEGWKDFETGIHHFRMNTQAFNGFCEWMEAGDCPIREIDLSWYLSKKHDELVKQGKLVIPEKTKEEKIKELDLAIQSSSPDSYNYEMFTEQRKILLNT